MFGYMAIDARDFATVGYLAVTATKWLPSLGTLQPLDHVIALCNIHQLGVHALPPLIVYSGVKKLQYV